MGFFIQLVKTISSKSQNTVFATILSISLLDQMVRRGIDEVVLSLSLVELSLELLVELSPIVLHGSFSGQTLVTHLPLIQIVELEAIPSAYCS